MTWSDQEVAYMEEAFHEVCMLALANGELVLGSKTGLSANSDVHAG